MSHLNTCCTKSFEVSLNNVVLVITSSDYDIPNNWFKCEV